MPARTMFRGDTFTLQFQVVKDATTGALSTSPIPGIPPPNKIPYDLTGKTVWMTVKRHTLDPDYQAIFQGNSAALGGVAILTALSGTGFGQMPARSTLGFPDGPTPLVYDLQVTDGLGGAWTVEAGTVTVNADVTNATAAPAQPPPPGAIGIGAVVAATPITLQAGVISISPSAIVGNVANLAALAAVDDRTYPDGFQVWVSSMRCDYVLAAQVPGALPADPSPAKYVVARSGRTWVQSNEGHASWRAVVSWKVDLAAGDDENPGTDPLPMRTVRGVNRKLGMGRRPRLPAVVHVRVAGSVFVEDVTIDADLAGTGAYSLEFEPVVVHSGTFTAAHFPQPGGGFSRGEDITFTDSTGTFDFGPYAADGGYRVDVTSGTGAGFSCFIVKALSGGRARVTYLTQWPGPGGAINAGNNQYVPTLPCTYEIVKLPSVTGAIVDATAAGIVNGQSWAAGMQVHDCAIDNFRPSAGFPILVGCVVAQYNPGGAVVCVAVNCVFAGIVFSAPGGQLATFSGGFMVNNTPLFGGFGAIYGVGTISCDEGPIFQGIDITVGGVAGPFGASIFDIHERCGFFDLSSAPQIVVGGQLLIGADGFFGNGNTFPILSIGAGAFVGVTGTPSLAADTTASPEVVWSVGTGGVADTARSYDPATDLEGASLQVTTFAALATSIGGGGFGYNAVRRNGARFVQV